MVTPRTGRNRTMRTLRALTILPVIQVLFAVAIFGFLAHISNQRAKAEGATADANEHLMSHNMVGNLPTVCFWRPTQGRYTCRVNARVYLSCQPRGFFGRTLNPNRCTLVDVPETR